MPLICRTGLLLCGQGTTESCPCLAVYGDLTMKNVTIKSGYASAEAISEGTQPYTLAVEEESLSGNRNA